MKKCLIPLWLRERLGILSEYLTGEFIALCILLAEIKQCHITLFIAYFNADPVLYAKEYEDYMKDASKRDKSCPDIYVMQASL